MSTEVYVYCFLGEERNEVKIGTSSSPDSRIAGVRTSYPGKKLCIYKTYPFSTRSEALNFEKEFHQKYDHLRLGGEWFSFEKSLKSEVDSWDLEAQKERIINERIMREKALEEAFEEQKRIEDEIRECREIVEMISKPILNDLAKPRSVIDISYVDLQVIIFLYQYITVVSILSNECKLGTEMVSKIIFSFDVIRDVMTKLKLDSGISENIVKDETIRYTEHSFRMSTGEMVVFKDPFQLDELWEYIFKYNTGELCFEFDFKKDIPDALISRNYSLIEFILSFLPEGKLYQWKADRLWPKFNIRDMAILSDGFIQNPCCYLK